MSEFDEKLDELIHQAETEKSHYYVRSVLKECKAQLTEAHVEIERATARLDIATKALEFYDSGEHFYSPSSDLKPGKYGYDDPDEIVDRGETASDALADVEKLIAEFREEK